MQTPQILGMIGDGLLCLIYLSGIVAGIIGLVRRKTLPGILAAGGFLLLSINVAMNYVISFALLPALVRSGANAGEMYGWLQCLRTPLYLFGAAALAVLAFTLLASKKNSTEPATEAANIPEIPPMP